MITREALDKVRDLRKFYLYPHDWHQGIDENAGRRCGYEAGFDAAVSLLWPVIEVCRDMSEHSNECFSSKCDRDGKPCENMRLREALSELKERVK